MKNEEAISKFLDYLTNVKNYSSHTVLSYQTDLREFLDFIISERMAPDLFH